MVLVTLSHNLAIAQDKQTLELTTFISQLERRYEIKFSYVDTDIEGIEIQVPSANRLQEILNSVAQQTGIEIKQLNERYYALSKSKFVNVCGRVLDNFAKNTIPGATIQVLGTQEALITDAEGNFKLENVERTTSLQVRYLGYTTKIVPISDLILENDCPKILLAERREALNEVVVYEFLTKGIIKETDGSVTLNTGELGLLPGLAEPDVLFGVQALPGIKSIDETVSDINIRGGTNDQNLILWNGIKMYQSGHFFGLISAFNPYLTEKVSIYKNGTPAQYGDGVSGVISMETKNTIEDHFFGGAGFNFISGDVFGQVPLSERLAFQFSARRSTTDFLDTPVYGSFTDRAFQDTEIRNEQNQRINENLEQEETFLFYDFSGKVLYDINDYQKIRLSFIAIDNDLDFAETDTAVNETSRSFLDQTNLSAGLQWYADWTGRFSTHANVYFSKYDLDARSFFPNQVQRLFQENTVEERQAKITSAYRFSNSLNWINGYQYIETGIINEARVTEPGFDLNEKNVIRIQAPFSEIRYRTLDDRFIASGGLRANYIENIGTFSQWLFEPRINLNFRLANYVRGQVLGEFKSQSTNQVIDLEQNFLGVEKRRWTLSNEEELPLTQSKQGSVGINYAKNQFYLGVEAFYKNVDGVSTRTQGFQNENQFNGELGSYEAKGVEFLINQKGKNYSTWLSYTYNKNDYTYDSIVPSVFPNNLDVRHTLTLAGTFDIGNLKLGAGINYRTGRPYTEPLEDSSLDTNVFPAQINFEAPNSSRLPEYFRMDASATYAFGLSPRVKAKAGVSLLNLTDRTNILNRYYRVSEENDIERVDNTSLGLTPNFNFRVTF
ncbi:MAG: TonB-dependent receptor [Bacteroidota bacterium]